ncbi:MAG: nucleoside monophosphate kinase [Candidatus Paceibacterota bacterium]
MKQITCVFFGCSGAGKGTQANLLIDKLKKIDPENETIYIETGERFRKFISSNDSYASLLAKEVLTSGSLLPAFLPIWMWASIFVESVGEKNHMILDGLARRGEEAPILDSAIRFFKRPDPVVIFLDTHNEEATRRLLARGRHDDKKEKIESRLKWFEDNVMDSIRYFEKNDYCKFFKIDGNQTIEKVHQDITNALGI